MVHPNGPPFWRIFGVDEIMSYLTSTALGPVVTSSLLFIARGFNLKRFADEVTTIVAITDYLLRISKISGGFALFTAPALSDSGAVHFSSGKFMENKMSSAEQRGYNAYQQGKPCPSNSREQQGWYAAQADANKKG